MSIRQLAGQYRDGGAARFHTPGHKGRPIPRLPDFEHFLPHDITELPFTGSLYDGDGPIAAAEAEVARVYGAADCLFSAGGSTLCIQTMLAMTVGMGGTVIAGRNLHHSAVNTFALMDMTPVWLFPDNREGRLPVGVYRPDQLEVLLRAHPEARAVYLTCPDYFGTLSDLAALAAVCHAHGVPLLIDNAHGAHLGLFSPSLHPMALDADFCCDSFHKTLPALTGGAVLLCRQPVDRREWKAGMSLFGSTSPNFAILSSLEQCGPYLAMEGMQEFAAAAGAVAELERLSRALGFFPLEGKKDPARFTVQLGGYSEAELESYFNGQGIFYELCSGDTVVFIVTPQNLPADTARLADALRRLPRRAEGFIPYPAPGMGPVRMGVRQAMFAPARRLPVEQAYGRVCSSLYLCCPPGVPLCIPGEELMEKEVQLLKNNGIHEVKVVE